MAGKNQFELQSFVKQIEKEVDSNTRKNLQNAGKFTRKKIQEVLNVKHRSSPGDPPGKLSGKLRKSIRYKAIKEDGEHVLIVGSNDFKANWLEFGTSKMAARPFLFPTIDKHKSEIIDIMTGKLVE
jgi:HK97 gp10 family phage protein